MLNKALSETDKLANILLTSSQLEVIKNLDFQNEKRNKGIYLNTSDFWYEDYLIGGIGAFALPPDPVINIFPGGIERQIYRPLQYARYKIDYMDLNKFGRDIYRDCSMHLETALDFYLDSKKFFKFLHSTKTLGQSVSKINNEQSIDYHIKDALNIFKELNNNAKHHINNSTRTRYFMSTDSLVSYFCSRILAMYFLNKMDKQKYPAINHRPEDILISTLYCYHTDGYKTISPRPSKDKVQECINNIIACDYVKTDSWNNNSTV